MGITLLRGRVRHRSARLQVDPCCARLCLLFRHALSLPQTCKCWRSFSIGSHCLTSIWIVLDNLGQTWAIWTKTPCIVSMPVPFH